MTQPRIGFIGTGVMGKSMIRHLMKGGYDLYIYNRTKEKARELINEGAHWCETPGELAESAPIIFTIVGYPSDVEELYLGKDGLLNRASRGTTLVDMTTSKPALAQRLYEEASKRELHMMDAPVSGGDVGAKQGTLAIMVGGEKAVFDTLLPLFRLFGENIQLQGRAGAGQYTKMANQIAVAGTMLGVSEALAYAKTSGLDQDNVLKSIQTGAARSFALSELAPRMVKGDFEPGFYIKHFIKDMRIAIESAEELGLKMPGLSLAKELYEKLAETGQENAGTQALYTYYINH
ncbi:NAD(P)-dependent oxidoreductase [Salipaludibacillus agaradhaerens]|uniref:NAD(P)-dependent oxidoreductase n=1 Tax=Salipaludibacillus agaradhaerens TaxID=76935 RepID=A0A9Q4G0L7_SALAG|nr:NAD(P)-dependent oxidoreductase [Salipaludibacillus agaradhaerens]MCR6098626.1 NAD(P)-dependent oxidoreductase [Salipaludibacillus agaradhaerens]MCR6115633.1 NAD(P)-dependent oxidoreductase [Salipaludibacillus agaradhaerens]